MFIRSTNIITLFLLINLIFVPLFLAEKPNTENTFIGNSDVLIVDTDQVEIQKIKRRRRGTFWKAVGAGALIGGGVALASKMFRKG
ncbi:hypothetical protein Mgra_00000558 [Meloidogyne graminicola]|uniref:Uncharacterized protein n=1 Tax=Meloidogyne graminicola TaxID=189291 RepID=A0A8T0A3J6_9BILA|nr:hypothetical protein Mgra_00000558 [Meloidogyne graminicola]